MSKLYSLIFVLIFTILFSQEYPISSIPEALKTNANAVIRNDIANITIKAIDDMEISNETVISILDKAGDEQALVMIPYDKTRRISEVKVQIIDQFGKVINKYGKSDFTDVSQSSAGALYMDDRVLFLRYVSNSYPYTIKYSYTVNTPNTIFISDYYPFLSYNVSLQNSEMNIFNKSGINLRTKTTESSIATISKSENANNLSYKFKNIAALEKENYAPSLKTILPKVEFSLEKFNLEGKKGDFNSWNTFGNWYYNSLLSPVSEVTPEIKAEVDALHLSGTISEKVKKLYQYMQGKTRYVNVSIGIGGWQPMPPEDVRKKGYGDCKGLSNYMRTLLSAADIKSYYSIITSDGTPQSFDASFPKMGGNHVILLIPTEKDNIWLENTSQRIAYNHLSFYTTDRNVLAVKENGIELIPTPSYKPEENKEIVKAKIILQEDNSIDASADFLYANAQYDFNRGLLELNQEELRDELKERYSNLKIENLKFSPVTNNRETAEISYTMNFKAKDYAKKIGNDMFFRVLPLQESVMLGSSDNRKLPFENPFSYQDSYEIEFNIPNGYKMTEKPQPVSLSSEFGNYSLDFKYEQNKITVLRKLTIFKGIHPKEKFQSYIDFRKKTTSYDNTKILITKS